MHFWTLSCDYFTAYPSRTKTFKPSEIYPSRALSPRVTIWLLAAAAWSLLPPSPLSVLLHSIFHSPPVATDSLPLQWWPLHCMQEQQACAAACSAASQHPDGLHSCCCVPAHRLHPPHTYRAWDTARAMARAEHTASAWPQERRTFVFFYGILMKLGCRNAVSSVQGSKTEISKENISDPLPSGSCWSPLAEASVPWGCLEISKSTLKTQAGSTPR